METHWKEPVVLSSQQLDTVTDAVQEEAAPAPVIPAWLLDADEEEQRELEALGVVADPTFREESERDALASKLLRQIGELDEDVERYDNAEQQEHLAITQRYDRLRAPSKRQRSRLVEFMLHLAFLAVFAGKAKSRKVGWGTYGRRKVPDKVDFTDASAAAMHMGMHHPEVTQAKLAPITLDQVQLARDAITKVLAGEHLDGEHVSALSMIRKALTEGELAVSKAAVLPFLQGEKPEAIPGAQLLKGSDKPWYEVEKPL